jgi:[ribosomal protein S18]-alanine N-acetyltransferase
VSPRLTPVPALGAEPLAALHRACFPDDPWDAAAIAGILALRGFFGRLAWAEESPVGFAFALDLAGECEILSLGTLPQYRRAGIARALLAEVSREARERRAEFAALEVAIDNRAARALYGGFGFTEVGSRPKYYRRGNALIDAVILRLPLVGASLFA